MAPSSTVAKPPPAAQAETVLEDSDRIVKTSNTLAP
jgi:hypothetical protein